MRMVKEYEPGIDSFFQIMVKITMYLLYILTGLCLLLSFIKSRRKSAQALKIAWKKFSRLVPAFSLMLVLVGIALTLIPDRLILEYLGGRGIWTAAGIAALFGSITMIPGFIAFPLSGILHAKGVAYMVLSAFTTTLMMVGVATLPVEQAYTGMRVALVRNLISLVLALIVALVTGLYFGELW